MRQNSASRIEVAELEELIQDEKLMEEYVQLMAMESMLVASFSNEGADSFDRLFPHPAHKSSPANQSSWWVWGGIAAAFVLGFTGFWAVGQFAKSVVRPDGATVLVEEAKGSAAVVSPPVISGWLGLSAGDQKNYVIGSELADTALSLSSGLLEINSANGCRLIIEGPAGFRMTSSDALYLAYGKVAVESPGSTRSITVHYGEDHQIWNGASFAVSVPGESTGSPEITSFHGNLHIRARGAGIRFSVDDHQSLRHLSDGSAQTIPFAGDEFLRELPAPELAWKNIYYQNESVAWITPDDAAYSRIYSFGGVDDLPYGIAAPKTLTFDIDGLVWGPGQHRAILKWMNGPDAMSIEQMELYRNGELVAEDLHTGKTGDLANTESHIYHLTIPEEGFQRGGWELRAKVRGIVRRNGDLPKFTEGVLYFGDRKNFAATSEDFVGDWHYQFNGRSMVREIKADGTITLVSEGKEHTTGQWWMNNGLLDATMNGITEVHMLRDKRTLIFVDRPYNNATRRTR